jgi:RimJ/RimL family protein N-acetyltransferase
MADYVVREARPEDAAAIIAHVKRVADEPNNGISISSAAEFTYTEDEEVAIIEKYTQADNALMLVAEASGQIIGVANCRGGDGGYYQTLGLGLTVHRDWRDRGIGSAMLRYMIDWCRANPVVHKLELWVFPDNPRAIHVYEKLGFEHEGNRRSAFLKEGRFRDILLMGMVFER